MPQEQPRPRRVDRLEAAQVEGDATRRRALDLAEAAIELGRAADRPAAGETQAQCAFTLLRGDQWLGHGGRPYPKLECAGRIHGSERAHPQRSGLSEAGHSLLRHFDAAGACEGLAHLRRADARSGRPYEAGPPRRHRVARLPGRGAARLHARLRLRHGEEARQAAGATIPYTYDLEYGSDSIEIQADGVRPGQRVVIADDLLATGGTMQAAINLVRKVGGEVVGSICIIELAFLEGRKRLDVPFKAMLSYDS